MKEMKMTKFSMRAISAAAATAAVLAFGMAHAQTNVTPAGSTEAGAMATNKTGNASTTNSKDNISPAPTGGMAKTADARTMSKEDKASAKAAKRAARKAKRTTNAGVDPSAMNPGGVNGSTATSKNKSVTEDYSTVKRARCIAGAQRWCLLKPHS